MGVDPPKWHDVGPVLKENSHFLKPEMLSGLDEIIRISLLLRKEREIAFYGDVDLIPTKIISNQDVDRAISWADNVIAYAELVIKL